MFKNLIISFMGSDCITSASLDKYKILLKLIIEECESKNISIIFRLGEASSCDNAVYPLINFKKGHTLENYVPNFKNFTINAYRQKYDSNLKDTDLKKIKIDNLNSAKRITKYGCANGVWTTCTEIDRLVYLRNTYQLRGVTLFEPSKLLYCWTPDGITNGKFASLKTGSIQHSCRLCSYSNIPLLNSFNYSSKSKFKKDLLEMLDI
jgi:hypothetical protein